jgi:hypothetical protein
MPTGPLIQVFNNGDYWVQDAKVGPRSAPPPVADEIRAAVQRDVVLMLNGLADRRLTAVRKPDLAEGGKSWPVIEVSAQGVRPVTLILDPATSLISRMRYASSDGAAASMMEESYTDYRDVKGLKVPFRTTISSGGFPYVQRVVQEIQFNVPLDASLFVKPI